MARILVVEDDQDARLLLSACLRRAGHTVVLAVSGYEALSLVCEQGVPEAAVLDLQMPGMNGFEVLEHLHATGMPKERAVFVTAVQCVRVRSQATSVGAGYLAKPFLPTDLAQAVDAACAA
jgi:CheY-like chemotaxis protein